MNKKSLADQLIACDKAIASKLPKDTKITKSVNYLYARVDYVFELYDLPGEKCKVEVSMDTIFHGGELVGMSTADRVIGYFQKLVEKKSIGNVVKLFGETVDQQEKK